MDFDWFQRQGGNAIAQQLHRIGDGPESRACRHLTKAIVRHDRWVPRQAWTQLGLVFGDERDLSRSS
jgi:hypothetical protein